jgi:hypothetical protein
MRNGLSVFVARVFLLLCFILSSPVFANAPSDRLAQQNADQREWVKPVRRLILVVPIYREFYVENIGRLLTALAQQRQSRKSPLIIEVVFDVNNTVHVDQAVRTENEETVAYLRELSRGSVPYVNPKHRDLGQAARAVLGSDLILHVLDHTSPGYQERNIGRVRDFANRYALSLVSEAELDHTIIAQMDGDCTPPLDYAAKIQSVFSYGNFAWAMSGLDYLVEPHSDPRIFQRHRVDSLDMAIWEFEAAQKNILPASGSPRIVMRARTLKELGGIPHLPQGEDTQLVTNLKERFGSSGTAIVNLSVGTAYRGRADSYDGAIFLQRIDWGQEVPEHLSGRKKELMTAENEIRSWGLGWANLLNEETRHFIALDRSTAELNRSQLNQLLLALQSNLLYSIPENTSALIKSDWWVTHVKTKWIEHSKDAKATQLALEREFPEQLGEAISPTADLWARFRATANLLRLHRIDSQLPLQPTGPVVVAPMVVPAPPMATPVARARKWNPFVVRLDNSAGVLELHADASVGPWIQGEHLQNEAGRRSYRVNPQQPVRIYTHNCAGQIWVAGQLNLEEYRPQNSAERLNRF